MSDQKIKEESKGFSINEESLTKGQNSKHVKEKLSDSRHLYKTGKPSPKSKKSQTPKKIKKRIKKENPLPINKKSPSDFSFVDHNSKNFQLFNILNKIPKGEINENYLKTKLKEDLKVFNSDLSSPNFFNNNFKIDASISIFNISDISELKSYKNFKKKKRSLKECSDAFENAFTKSLYTFRLHKYILQIGEKRSKIDIDIDRVPKYDYRLICQSLFIDCSVTFNSKKRTGLILVYCKSDSEWISEFNEIVSSDPNMDSTTRDKLNKFWFNTNWKNIFLFLIISKTELVHIIAKQLNILSNHEDLEDYISMIQNEPIFSKRVSIRIILNPHDLFLSDKKDTPHPQITIVDYKMGRV